MNSIISVKNLNKTYEGGFQALKNVNLEIEEGEIFALLGPNGAGKTTLISTICGISTPTQGEVRVGGHDITTEFRKTREMIGLVPQELTADAFELVSQTVSFSRGLFGKPRNQAKVNEILESLSLADKKNNKLMTLSGGMKRRVMIAKALAHEPKVLFLDEPTAGVDVELRKDMWQQVRKLRDRGVTIILTTHYIEEAELMADRIGIINKGEIILVDKKETLMNNLGTKQLIVDIANPPSDLPSSLKTDEVKLIDSRIQFTYDARKENTGVMNFLDKIKNEGFEILDFSTKQSSLEEIFVDLVKR